MQETIVRHGPSPGRSIRADGHLSIAHFEALYAQHGDHAKYLFVLNENEIPWVPGMTSDDLVQAVRSKQAATQAAYLKSPEYLLVQARNRERTASAQATVNSLMRSARRQLGAGHAAAMRWCMQFSEASTYRGVTYDAARVRNAMAGSGYQELPESAWNDQDLQVLPRHAELIISEMMWCLRTGRPCDMGFESACKSWLENFALQRKTATHSVAN